MSRFSRKNKSENNPGGPGATGTPSPPPPPPGATPVQGATPPPPNTPPASGPTPPPPASGSFPAPPPPGAQPNLGPKVLFGIADTRDFVLKVQAGEFAAATEIYDRQPDWQHRNLLIRQTSKAKGRPEYFDAWVAEQPGHPLPLLASGDHAVKWAWEVRTAARAQHVSQAQFAEFHNRLRWAEEILAAAVRADPSSPLPWISLLGSGMGLGVPMEEERYRFESSVERAPMLDAHKSFLQFVCGKWHGSHEEMWDYVKSATTTAPEASPMHALVAAASFEEHGDTQPRSKRRKALKKAGGLQYLLDSAEKSVFHPAFDANSIEGIDAASSFAGAFLFFDLPDQARRLIPIITYASGALPFGYMLDDDEDPDVLWATLKQELTK